MTSSLVRCSSSTSAEVVRQFVYRNELNYFTSDEVGGKNPTNELTPRQERATTDGEGPMTDLLDYCRSCVAECGCGRTDTLTEPFEIDWPGCGAMLTPRYECDGGHQWLCRWSPELLDGMGE